MAQSRRVSPNQHYHVREQSPTDDYSGGTVVGTFRYDQGPYGANASVRKLARAKTREYGSHGEMIRISVGWYRALRWNKQPDNYDQPEIEWEIVESVTYLRRLCFEPSCVPSQEGRS